MQNVKKNLIIAGLGNPGLRYRNTLHNVGYKVLEKLAHKYQWSWKFESRFQSEIAKGTCRGCVFHCLRPETFMNLSGEAVKAYLEYFDLDTESLIAVADDADLKFGDVRLKALGGSGGHNGLKSIEKELLTNAFKRVRMGIGRPKILSMDLADYVLLHQEPFVWDQLEASLDKAVMLLERLAEEPFENVMKDANTIVKLIDGETNEKRP